MTIIKKILLSTVIAFGLTTLTSTNAGFGSLGSEYHKHLMGKMNAGKKAFAKIEAAKIEAAKKEAAKKALLEEKNRK